MKNYSEMKSTELSHRFLLTTARGNAGLFLPAIRTEALYEILDFVQFISDRTGYRRDMDCIQAESFVAGLAIEMAMQLVGTAVMIVMADAIFFRATSVFSLVYKMTGSECLQRPENR